VTRGRRGWRIALLAVVTLLVGAGEGRADDASNDPTADALGRLRAFESAERRATDFRTLPAYDQVTGPDPVAIRHLAGKPLLVGLLRGRSALVLLDEDLRELQRLATPPAPSGLVVTPGGDVFVSAELSPAIAHYVIRDGRLVRRAAIPLRNVRSVRAIAAGDEGVLYVVEDHDHRLLTVDSRGSVLAGDDAPIGLGPRHVLRTTGHVVVDCILAHTVVVRPVDARGRPLQDGEVRIAHDGPIWSVDARETPDGLMLALGGVEDHPLDRREGSFGYIDSFVWIYRVAGTPPKATRLAEVDVSALGVVTPKIVALTPGDPVRLRVRGYGDAPLAELTWPDRRVGRKGLWPRPEIVTRSFVPGGVMEAPLAGGRTVVADPLLDAWVVDDGSGTPRLIPVPDPGRRARSVESRVGEALFFTTAMAPWNRTRGSLSRFTCETCHFEGGVDGRVHHSGRDDVRVTTRPLFGLGNDRPYFSRALDPDLAGMVHNEFHVAGLRSRHDSWFSLGVADVPWLAALGTGPEPLSPEVLRRSLMTFLMGFTHRPNPSVVGRRTWSRDERHGAEVFRDRCARCHAARLVTDLPESTVPFADWERLVMSPAGAIVWARDTREQTGIVPYVHPEGTRVPSLRRLYRKRPYFTNGSSADLASVLARARVMPDGFLHDAAPGSGGEPLDPGERAAVLAFLDLL
jgi:hypothetical protein